MSSSPPHAGVSEPAGRARRPRWLVVALCAAFALGAGCWTDGCNRLAFYRGALDPAALEGDQPHNEAARAKADALYLRYTEVADAERARALPFAAATFVLGAALVFLVLQARMGREGVRRLLVQLVCAQAVVVAGSWFATRRVAEAELDWDIERSLLIQQERLPSEQVAEVASMFSVVKRFGPPGWLFARTVASGLIVFALTRPRSREFFESAAPEG